MTHNCVCKQIVISFGDLFVIFLCFCVVLCYSLLTFCSLTPVSLLSEMSLKIAAMTDVCLLKIAILFLRERFWNKRVRELSRLLLDLTRAVESARPRSFLN